MRRPEWSVPEARAESADTGTQLTDRIEEEKEKNLEFERKLVAALLGT